MDYRSISQPVIETIGVLLKSAGVNRNVPRDALDLPAIDVRIPAEEAHS
jgi:hypothetical protein